MDVGMGQGDAAFANSTMAPFLTKLYQIVSAASTDHCIQWTPKGDSFVISDPDTFARDILPTYFKHNNIRSFIRQLNTYGFRKRTNISSTDEHLEFFHAKFRRDDPQGLSQIKRCHQPKASAPSQRGGGGPITSGAMPMPQDTFVGMTAREDLGQYNPDLDSIRSRVTELKTRLGSLQTEIRDYNTQMEQKVNLLMHILQSSNGPNAGSMPRGIAGQGGTAQQAPSQPGGLGGGQSQQSAGGRAAPTQQPPPSQQPALPPRSNFSGLGAGGGMPPSSQPGAGTNPMNDLAGRRDSLLASLGQQSALGSQLSNLSSALGLGAMPGLGGMPGLSGGVPGLGGIGGLGGMSGLGGGLGGLGGGLGGIGGGLMGPNAALLSSLGGAAGMSSLMGGLGGFGGLGDANKGGEVAGLQHLLEAAQRQQTQEGGAGHAAQHHAAAQHAAAQHAAAAAAAQHQQQQQQQQQPPQQPPQQQPGANGEPPAKRMCMGAPYGQAGGSDVRA